MSKIIGNTTTTPMVVADLSQTNEKRADFVKNKKLSLLENDAGYIKDTDIGTTEKAGIVRFANYEEIYDTSIENLAVSPFGVEEVLREKTLKDITDKQSVVGILPVSAVAVWDYVDNVVGDVSSALDELHAYATSLAGGAE